jgi:hypothetical protein
MAPPRTEYFLIIERPDSRRQRHGLQAIDHTPDPKADTLCHLRQIDHVVG